MKRIAIYPGSFDPPTLGHLDIIHRATRLCDELVVAVLKNSAKTPLFSVFERVNMLKEITKEYSNVRICSFDGLLVDFAKEQQAIMIVRGLRAVTDFEYELQLSQLNKELDSNIETVFLTTSLKYSYLSSSIVKEIASFGGDISGFVSPYIHQLVIERYRELLNEQDRTGNR